MGMAVGGWFSWKSAIGARTCRSKSNTIRPQKVTIQALNEYGEEIIVDGEDEMAKCFCHELEHLDGMIFLDKAIEELSVV